MTDSKPEEGDSKSKGPSSSKNLEDSERNEVADFRQEQSSPLESLSLANGDVLSTVNLPLSCAFNVRRTRLHQANRIGSRDPAG